MTPYKPREKDLRVFLSSYSKSTSLTQDARMKVLWAPSHKRFTSFTSFNIILLSKNDIPLLFVVLMFGYANRKGIIYDLTIKKYTHIDFGESISQSVSQLVHQSVILQAFASFFILTIRLFVCLSIRQSVMIG